MTPDWQTTLTPLLVILVPVLLSQGKRLLGRRTWLVPIIAPLLAAGLDLVSWLTTQTQVGSTKAAVLGLAGVGLREVLDQMRQRATQPMIPPVRSIVAALALPTLLLAGCASGDVSKGLVISGRTLKAVGQEFVATATAFKAGCDAGTIAADRCQKFGAFEKVFKQDYPFAVAAWKRAVSTADAIATGDTEAQILGMALDLGLFAVQVGIPTAGGK